MGLLKQQFWGETTALVDVHLKTEFFLKIFIKMKMSKNLFSPSPGQ
jgi:hypothetical protein